MKYVIWGFGKRGHTFLELLGKERVACFIDSDVTLHNEKQDIPVYSYEEYQTKGIGYPILISPIGKSEEIRELLTQEDKNLSLVGDEEYDNLEGLICQAPQHKLFENMSCYQRLVIVGYSLYALLLYEMYYQSGYEVAIVLPYKQYDLKTYLQQNDFCILDVEHIALGDGVLLSRELTSLEEKELLRYVEEPIPFYRLGLRLEWYDYPQIKRFKDLHKNERCFVVATGPSLTLEDIEVLYQNREVCISMNSIFRLYESTRWRPDYYMISDPTAYRTYGNEIFSKEIRAFFLADVIPMAHTNCKDNLYRWHLQREYLKGNKPHFSDDFSKCSYWGQTITYDGALQLAVYMGFREIYLLGVDCNYVRGSISNHFNVDSKGDYENHHEEEMLLAYQAAKDYADAHEIKIYNATRGGMLEVFERVEFDTLFARQ